MSLSCSISDLFISLTFCLKFIATGNVFSFQIMYCIKCIKWSAMYLVLPFVWTSKLLPVTTIRPFRVTVESVLLYGSETWTVTKKLEKSVNGCYTRMLRTALHVHWRQHMNNQELYRSLPRVSETICARRLRLAATVHVTMKTIKMLF